MFLTDRKMGRRFTKGNNIAFLTKWITLAIIVLISSGISLAQKREFTTPKLYSDTIFKTRAWILGGATTVLWAGSVAGLNQLWYANEPRSKFHFFDDSKDWMQLDKAGHFMTSWSIGYYYIDLMRASGFNRKTSIWTGGFMGSFYLAGIEVLDGFSSTWGFSVTDFTANTAGSFAVIIQELAWNEQRIIPKISYHPSRYAQYRPDLLGSNFGERMLKDYNGQTYWYSANIHSFLKDESKFPRWLNFAVGFGADGMTGGVENPQFDNNGNPIPKFIRHRQFYISLDVDLTKIRTRKKWLRTLFKTVALIKLPFPTIEFNALQKVKFHPIYF
ncbi:MAG: DUF2279 domain-containing protein [Flavobacteriales bacterium]|nr:DUF2279 domain-containing protein [Flavobacteriales bacterium]